MAVTIVSGVQYSGIWNISSQANAKAAGTWPSAPVPHLYAWGNNANGQLGTGSTTSTSSPVQVGSLSTWSVISASNNASASIKTDGTLWNWGGNGYGQLGLGNTTYYSSPKQVGSLTNWSTVSINGSVSMAIKTDGTLWTWGRNNYGQLGIGNTADYSSPKQVGALTNWSKVSCGGSYGIGIKTDGTIWSWGRNTSGQLGLGTAGAGYSYSSPKQIGSLTNWASVSASPLLNVAAIKTDGTLWTWGSNTDGQIGDGTKIQRNSPVQVGSLTNWLTASAGSYACIALKTDGTIWSWGSGGNGQLGLGNQTPYSSPKQIGALTTWASAHTSIQFFMGAIKTNGTMWDWGYNIGGQLGLGNTSYFSSPVQVGTLTTWTKLSMGDSHSLAIVATV